MLEYVKAFARDELDLALVDPGTLVTHDSINDRVMNKNVMTCKS